MPIRPENKTRQGSRACGECGASFVPYRRASAFCSTACRKKQRRVIQSTKPCRVCGGLFTPAGSQKAIYCSERCKRSTKPPRSADARRAYAKTDRYRFNQRNLKAKRRAAERAGGVTHQEWIAILAAFDGRCAYCRKDGPMTMDHVTPLSRGGLHIATNIVPACQPCNSSKRDRDWSHKIRELTDEPL